MMYATIEAATADCIAKGGEPMLVVWDGMKYITKPIHSRGFGGCIIGHSAPVDEYIAEAKAQGFSYGLVVYIDGR